MVELHDPNQDTALILQPVQARRVVLNVEYDSGSAVLMEEIFSRRSDLKLLTAIDCLEGVEMAGSNRPDTILMDIDSRDICFRAFGLLHEDPATADIPVIALSSDAKGSDVMEGLRRGFFRYLIKPYHLEELMNAVDDALQYAADNSSLK